ncbi:MAG: alpha/beta hydrolase fold domain-containing protein [Polaribacter sp.]
MKIFKTINVVIFLLIATNFSYAQNSKPKPDLANVKYGDHERNVLDVWFADKNKITPIAIFIHGGGFNIGSKDKINDKELKQLLAAGISVASISYRYKSIVPLPGSHYDAKLALQFIRSQAKSWGINKDKIGVWGGSAGAQISMWLAFSDDMANLKSTNPIERESTRVTCVATKGGQTTMESDFWLKHIAKYSPGDEITFKRGFRRNYGVKTIEEANEIAKSISALALISKDDPPIFMRYGMTPNASIPGKENKIRGWIVHHVDFGIALKEKMDKLNIESYLKYPTAKTKYKSLVLFFIDKLLE